MPFLDNLSSQAVVLDRHYSSGVDTDHGVFSLFTGLFPVTQPIQFDERRGLQLPTLFSFLHKTHRSFFVTGSDLRLWYPEALLENTGLQEVIDARNSTAPAHKYLDWTIRDEDGTGSILREMVQKASQPFVGVYYPYATHWPYTVYGDAGNKVSKTSKLERYGYNLRLVDDQIRKLFEVLRTRGILDRTIVAITADHGEAFGDQGTWGHGTSLLDIAVHVPMVIYQPRVFVPQHVDTITSHVDLLPTLLDAMGVQYDPAQFQGESLFRPQRRLYSFFYSPKSNQLGSIDFRGQKLVVDFSRDFCWTVDLVADSLEGSRKPCDRGSAQLAALKVFRRYNTELLFHLASENASGKQ
jgi:membrane-anchored protein YejM (alkaline phosphatase superfamily)